MPYLSAATHQSLLRDPATITHAWNAAAPTFKANIGWPYNSKDNDLIAAAFCSIVAYDLKPYGPCAELELSKILAAPAIDCDNYCILTWYLWKMLRPQSFVKMTMVGWDGGAVGNHAQLFVGIPDKSSWLLDPTIGLIVGGATFDRVCAGEPITHMVQPAGARDPVYSAKIRTAISSGAYKPSDLLYYFDPPQRYVDLPRAAYWATPRAK